MLNIPQKDSFEQTHILRGNYEVNMIGKRRHAFPKLSFSTQQIAGEILFRVRNGNGTTLSALVANLYYNKGKGI